MDIYATENEQVEQLKKWWKEYGWTIIFAIVVGFGGNFGWRYWQVRTQTRLEGASASYEQLLVSIEASEASMVQRQADEIIERYPGTPYAALAALLLGQRAVGEKRWDEAKLKLFWVMDYAKSPVLRQVARLRVVRIMIQEKAYDHALALLKVMDDEAFKPAVEALRGDIYMALGKQQEARVVYARAIDGMPVHRVGHPLLQMKLDNM